MSKPPIRNRPAYQGDFVAVDGTIWRAELWVRNWPHTPLLDLVFDADSPIEVEWEDSDPTTTLQASSATIKIISQYDRQFIDLYAYAPADVWLKVLRVTRLADGTEKTALWWQGALDPEFYEEPYESGSGYTVSLTFTDFGYLDRIDYALNGVRTARELICHALEEGGFTAAPDLIRTSISTAISPQAKPATLLDDVAVDSRNWYDEDGEPSTLAEMLEGLLLPLALHMVQTAGHIYIYDDNALARTKPREIHWSADRQDLATEPTYNNVRITFSAYSTAEMLPDFEYLAKTAPGMVNWSCKPPAVAAAKDYGAFFTYARDYRKYEDKYPYERDIDYRSFTIFTADPESLSKPVKKQLDGLTIFQNWKENSNVNSGLYDGQRLNINYTYTNDLWPKAFHIEPLLDTSEAEGVAVMFVAGLGDIRDTWEDTPQYSLWRYGPPADIPGGMKLAEYFSKNTTYLNTFPRLSLHDYIYSFMQRPWILDEDVPHTTAEQEKVMQTRPIYLPPMPAAPSTVIGTDGKPSGNYGAPTHYIRLRLEMLLDSRYNPFTDGDMNNEKGHTESLLNNARWVFLPFVAVIRNDAGEITHVYSNRREWEEGRPGLLSLARGCWIERTQAGNFWLPVREEAGPLDPPEWDERAVSRPESPDELFGTAWLAWYSPEEDGKWQQGWQTNRHCIGRADVTASGDHKEFGKLINLFPMAKDAIFYESFKALPAGQYMPYPPAGGWLEVTIYRSLLGYKAKDANSSLAWPRTWIEDEGNDGTKTSKHGGRCGIYNQLRWMLFKAPQIDIINNDTAYSAAEIDDIEYSAYLDRNAHEELSLDSVCGTAPSVCPTARGLLLDAATGLPIEKLTRAGVTEVPEKLLIGTLFSQYSIRRTSLSGEATLRPEEPLSIYSDPAQDEYYADYDPAEGAPWPYFRIASRTADLRTMTADTTLSQIAPDNYSPDDLIEVEE